MEAGHSRVRRPLDKVRVLKPTAPPEGHFEKTWNLKDIELVSRTAWRQLLVACHLQRLTTGLALVLCCFLATALPAKADTGSDQDGWKFSGAAYLWAAGVEGTDAAGDEIDVSFSDVLEDLDGVLWAYWQPIKAGGR